jgi:hypothetical protein
MSQIWYLSAAYHFIPISGQPTVAALMAKAALAPMPTKTRDTISPAYVDANPEPIFAPTAISVKIYISYQRGPTWHELWQHLQYTSVCVRIDLRMG